MKCNLSFIYKTHHAEPTYINFHKHDCYEIVYYMSGNGTLTINDKAHTYQNNSIAVIAPGTVHDENNFKSNTVMVIGVNFKYDILKIEEGIYLDSNQIILPLLKQIFFEISGQNSYYEAMLEYKIGQLLIEIFRIKNTNKPRQKNKNFSYIVNYIEENYNQPIDIISLAQLCNFSYDRFRHLFKEKMGLPPKEYIINKRLNNAKQLLESTNLNIIDISLECGFYDSAQFSNIFKNRFDITPRQFRKNK